MEDNTNNNIQNEKESFCYKNKKIIIIISLIIIIILIIFIILLFTLILKKKDDEKEEEYIIQIDEETQEKEITQSDSIEIKEESTEKCLEYDSTNGECLICNKKYDLYKGDCIQYAFNVLFTKFSKYKKNQLFNLWNINGVYMQ